MATNQSNSPAELAAEPRAWTKEEVLGDLRIITMSRELDEVEKHWQKAGRAKFCILGAGQELAQLAAAKPLKNGDWLRSYYRGITEALTPREALAQVLGDAEAGHDPASGGRMMGRHFGSRVVGDDGELIDLTKQINHASDISPTASQMGPALGLAIASPILAKHPEIQEAFPGLGTGKEVVHVCIGDASMAEGIALETINQAVVQRVPLIISVYDNGYGISVPSDKQIAHASISKALSGFAPQEEGGPGLKIIGPVNGWDYPALRAAYDEAYTWARETGNPALVHAKVTQLEGHSSSGDHRRYKTKERLEWEVEKDGITCFRKWILENELASSDELEAVATKARDFVRAEAEEAWRQYYEPLAILASEARGLFERAQQEPGVLGALEQHHQHSSSNNLFVQALELQTDSDLKTRNYLTLARILTFARGLLLVLKGHSPSGAVTAATRDFCLKIESLGKTRYSTKSYASGDKSPLNAPLVAPSYGEKAESDTGAHVIAAGFATMMRQDPRVIAYGEDVGSLGGVTTCTLGLQAGSDQVEPSIWRKSPALKRYVPEKGFGIGRVWDTAIAEGTIVGAAAGLALRGLRPVGEIQYHDYVNYGAQQLEDELACLRHRSNGGQEAPAIIRCHGHRLLGMWHSGSPMAMMLRMPGLRVITPRNAVQAVAMYRAALQHGRDPVFSVEPLLDLYGKVPVPDNLDEVCLPLGHSEQLRGGDDLTIVTYGHCCTLALQAAELLQTVHEISVEVIDLQSLNPVDLNGVAAGSIRKTGKVLFFDEDYENGAMSMISKTLLFDRQDDDGRPMTWYLEAVKILSAPDHKPAYGTDGGFFSKPQVHNVVDTVCGMLDQLDGRGRKLY
ncbi:MAG: thiamine pyrophosphate-dependent enzyme [Planctomycetota bacterium]|nr:thiamine pyrophosphate-dependent enzyme [Planctomycetota bacterium]